MKLLKNACLFLGLTLAISQLNAQGDQGKRPHRDRGEFMAKKLNLSDDQRVQMKEIFEKYRNDFKQIYQSDANREDKITKAKDVQNRIDADVKKILNGDQYDQYREMKSRMMERGKEGYSKWQSSLDELNLTEEQREQLKTAMSDIRSEMSRDEKSELSKEERIQHFKTMRAKTDEAVQKILTADQLKKWKEMQAARQDEFKQRREDGRFGRNK